MEPAFVTLIEESAHLNPTYETAKGCLAAIRSVIKKSDGATPLTPVLYFAGASATLRQCGGTASQDVLAALILIMKQSMEGVSKACLSDHAELISVCSQVVQCSTRSDVAKGALEICVKLVDVLFDQKVRPPNKILKTLFPLLTDSRSYVRHKSHYLILIVLTRCAEREDASVTFEFLTNHVVHSMKSTKVAGDQDGLPVTHLVTLSENAAKLVPHEQKSALLKALMALALKFGQHPLSAKVLDAVSSFLDGYENYPADTRHELLKIIADPVAQAKGLGNAQGVDVLFGCACARVLTSTTLAFCKDLPNGESSIPNLCSKFLELFRSADPSVLERAVQGVKSILENAPLSVVQKMPVLLGIPLLNANYKLAYTSVFPCIGAIFAAYGRFRLQESNLERLDQFPEAHLPDVQPLIKALFTLRDISFGRDYYIYGEALDNSIGEAIRTFGASLLLFCPLKLREIPLTDPKYEQKSRSWMLPLMKQNLKQTRLATFFDFLTEASELVACASASKTSETCAKKYRTLVDQIWQLLPGFATEPVDLPQALNADDGKLARQMCHVLVKEEALRDSVAHALLALLTPLTEEATSQIVIQTFDRNKEVMIKFAGRIMPEMFTAYVQSNKDGKECLVVLEAIQKYAVVISQTPLLGNFFKTVVQRALKASQQSEPNVKESVALCELAIALLPSLDKQEALALAMNIFSPLLHEKHGALQKVAYKGIKTLYAHPKLTASVATVAELNPFWDILAKSRETCDAVAIKQRLLALREYLTLIEHCPFKKDEKREVYRAFLQYLVPEIMLRLREVGIQARATARECLHALFTATAENNLQEDFVHLLCAGLAGSRLLKTQALDALSRLLFEQNGCGMSVQLMDQLAELVLVLLKDEKIVFKTALKFCKIMLYVFPDDLVRKHLKAILVGAFASTHIASARMLVRKIVEKAIKRLPYEEVNTLFPEKHRPLLCYVSKMLDKRKRKKDDEKKGYDEFMEEEGEDEEASDHENEGRKRKTRKRNAVELEIHEDEDDVVDFLGQDTSAHLVATTKRRKLNQPDEEIKKLKVGDDGKLIVEESESESEIEEAKPRNKEKPLLAPGSKKSLSKLQALRKKRALPKKTKKTTTKGHTVKGLESFAPNKKGRGDAKKKNTMDPYAYVKFNNKLFKEKHKSKAVSSFETVTQGGKKALKGRKAKILLNSVKNTRRKKSGRRR